MSTMAVDQRAAKDRRIPAEAGVWLFVIGDMLIFGLFFCIFLYYRSLNPVLWAESQATLNVNFGAINTLLLLTSSLFVARALQALRSDQTETAHRFLSGALACGLGFSAIKVIEYSGKMGVDVANNDFYLYYFIFTGAHFFHVILGMGVLVFMMRQARQHTAGASLNNVEAGGIYWHMVDLLWIILFPLIYLVH